MALTRPVVSQIMLNLDRLGPHEIPSLQLHDINGTPMLRWNFNDTVVWLRADQVGEIIAKLAVHMPETSLPAVVMEEMLGNPRATVVDFPSVDRRDLDLPVRRGRVPA